MKQVKINVKEDITKILPEFIEKTLNDNERICTTCHGFEVVFHNGNICHCNCCVDGIQKVCEFCGELLWNYVDGRCDCGKAQLKLEENRNKKWGKIISEIKKYSYQDDMFYLEEHDVYYKTIEEFIDVWEAMHCKDISKFPKEIITKTMIFTL